MNLAEYKVNMKKWIISLDVYNEEFKKCNWNSIYNFVTTKHLMIDF